MNLSLILTAFLFGIMLALAYGRGRFLKLFSFDFFFFSSRLWFHHLFSKCYWVEKFTRFKHSADLKEGLCSAL